MGWDRVIGQQRVKDLLKRAIASGQIAHAYCFIGDEGVGKDALAIEFARALNCERGGEDPCDECASCRSVGSLQHPQVRLVVALPAGKGEKTGDDPVKGFTEDQIAALQDEMGLKARDPYYKISMARANFIKVNSIREIRRQAALKKFQRGKKVFILSDAESMNQEASNSLLKTLEEPPPDTVLILTTSRGDQLLPTILSRCQQIRCATLGEEEIASALSARDGIDKEEARVAAALANGSYSVARSLVAEDMGKPRREVVEFVRSLLKNNSVDLLGGIDGMLSSMERSAASRWLRLLQVWFHDALGVREGRRTNPDDDLDRFVRKFPQADLIRSAGAVERAIALVQKNVYLPLIFITLALELRASIHGKPPARIERGLPS